MARNGWPTSIGIRGRLAPESVAGLARNTQGRFGLANHRFYGLRGEEEIAEVLKRYDENAKWPIGSDVSYSSHFAPQAFAAGWRLCSHTKEITEIVNKLRASHGLPPLDEWPMKTFELFVQRILTRTVCAPGFRSLSTDDIQDALKASGYIKFEFSRMHLKDDEED